MSPNGTIAWAETDGKRTEFVYDAAFRVVTVKPSGGRTWTTYSYDNTAAAWAEEARAPAWTKTLFDGFGRTIGTIDHTNVKVGLARDECGRVSFQSYPYTAGAGTAGIVTTFDALDRPVTVTEGTAVTQVLVPSGRSNPD